MIDAVALMPLTLRALGQVHQMAGRTSAALSAWRQALELFTELGSPLADEIRPLLNT